jgi:hypothetical protein
MADPEKKEEEELVPVGEGVEEEKEELEEELEAEELEEEEGEDEEGEERLGAEEEDEEGDEKRSKRRDERKSRRQRQKTARDRDKTELNFLRGRNENLERQFSQLDARVGQSETAQIDTRINDVKSKIKLADQVITKAIDQSDGAAVVEAQGIRDSLRDNLGQLTQAKTYMTQQRQPQQPQVDPRLVQHAGAWMQDHTWWNPNGTDPDSLRVSEIDAQMVREGHDPTTADYWDELSDRVEEAIPGRFGNGDARAPRKKGKRKASGPTMSVSGRERPLKKNEVYISPDRKEAMIEAGVWEDPELRQKYLKQYAKYDAENRA